MGTIVHLRVITVKEDEQKANLTIRRAFQAIRQVEQACSRFDRQSELNAVCQTVGIPVPVSEYLFAPLQFAMSVSALTKGRFDPTLGRVLEELGFHEHYLTRETIGRREHAQIVAANVNFRDVVLDETNRTVTLQKPLTLDLGAVAKGFAIDLAASFLREFSDYIVDAGGDLYAAGCNQDGEPWHVAIRDPHRKDGVLRTVCLRDEAMCTSGSYERISTTSTGAHHLIDPQTQSSASELISCTVIAPFAMMADAFSTASFVMGVKEGLQCLEENGLDGYMIDRNDQVYQTETMRGYLL